MLDVTRLHTMLDVRRKTRGMSWRAVADEIGVSPSTFTRLGQGGKPDVDGFLAMSSWLNSPGDDGEVAGDGGRAAVVAAAELGSRIPVEGTVFVEGEPTGGGKMAEDGAITWPDGPVTIIWDRYDGDHSGQVVGGIAGFRREGSEIVAVDGWLSGDSEDPETQAAVRRAAELLAEGAVGVSVSLDELEAELRVSVDVIEQTEEQPADEGPDADGRVTIDRFRHDDAIEVITHGRIRHVAIVDTPAHADAKLAIAASGSLSLVRVEGFEDWFDDPKFGLPGTDDRLLYDPERDRWSAPTTVTGDGRVFGHVNPYGICLVGRPDRCILPPDANNGTFMRFSCPAAGGRRTGVICVGGSHADVNIGVAAATAHYDKTGRAVADVRVGSDAYGVWFAGRVRPGASDDDVYALASSGVSGHWEADERGQMCLVGLPAVNVEGFPKGYLTAAQVAAGAVAASASGKAGCGPCVEDRLAALEAAEAERYAAALDLDRRHADLLAGSIGV